MSIYATMWTLYFPLEGGTHPEALTDAEGDSYIEVYAQGVPGYIDNVGSIWGWLPPPVEDEDKLRAVVICGPDAQKGTSRNGQEYTNPLLILSGEEYNQITWRDLWSRIEAAVTARCEWRYAPDIRASAALFEAAP